MIKCTKVMGKPTIGIKEFYGLEKDVPNLPVNKDGVINIPTSSEFFCIDTGNVYMFEEESNKWYKL